MQISAPYPELGAPKVGKMWGLVQTVYAYFFPVFWRVHFLSEVLSVCKVLDGGVTPSPRYGQKTGFAAKPIFGATGFTASTLWAGETAVRLLINASPTASIKCQSCSTMLHGHCRAADVAVSGQSLGSAAGLHVARVHDLSVVGVYVCHNVHQSL